jgi:NTP pyrophosphatase (non-canonical NTP hydrolase)
MSHFNQLTPAEAERLAMLAEECGEVIQVIGKILRHGYASFHPDAPTGLNNRGLLRKEITDVVAVLSAMDESEDFDLPVASQSKDAWAKKLRYSHHQGDTP